MADSSQTVLMQFTAFHVLHFQSNLTVVHYRWSNPKKIKIGSGGGLVPISRQAGIWASADSSDVNKHHPVLVC